MTKIKLFNMAQEMRNVILLRHRRNKKKCALVKTVQLFRDGNYTIVLINNNKIGISKCNPSDKKNDIIGIHLALQRAVKALYKHAI